MKIIKALWDRVPDNVQWGLIWGAGFAGFFSLIAVAIWTLMVVATQDFAPWKDLRLVDVPGVEPGLSILEVLAAYWGGGLVAGALAGWMRPLAARSWWGASLAGIVAGIPVSGAIMLIIFGIDGWNRLATISWIVGFVIFGPFYAALIKSRYSGHLYQGDEGRWEIDPE